VTAVLALDQGTTGSSAVVLDETGTIRGSADREIRQFYPASAHVEHDPEEIFATTVAVGREALTRAGLDSSEVTAIGITNQRETTVVWERATGRPIHPAVVWQSRASAAICERLRSDGHEKLVRERTGLVIDAYFSGTKVRWILDQVAGAQKRAEAGELVCGTIDTWLIWKLTGGRTHVTDVSNASRTLVFDIHRGVWDDDLLGLLSIPRSMLATPVRSSGIVAEADAQHFGRALPIAGVAGDQQAALFGQTCFAAGEAKNTYGTGCFLLVNTADRAALASGGLLTTIAWDTGDGIRYALEGSAFITGAAVQWLRDGLGIIATAAETESLAAGLAGNDNVYLVPAFTGLGAPHWDMYARGLLIGIERGTTRAHVVRATLESIAYQTRDLLEAMRAAGQPIEVLRVDGGGTANGLLIGIERGTTRAHVVRATLESIAYQTRDLLEAMRAAGQPIDVLRVDGGGTANGFLMQFQADVAGIPVEVAAIQETTALGAAFLAGLATGVWKSPDDLRRRRAVAARYEPRMSADERESLYAGWQRAVDRSRGWAAAGI